LKVSTAPRMLLYFKNYSFNLQFIQYSSKVPCQWSTGNKKKLQFFRLTYFWLQRIVLSTLRCPRNLLLYIQKTTVHINCKFFKTKFYFKWGIIWMLLFLFPKTEKFWNFITSRVMANEISDICRWFYWIAMKLMYSTVVSFIDMKF
jgi:hypothetical protein